MFQNIVSLDAHSQNLKNVSSPMGFKIDVGNFSTIIMKKQKKIFGAVAAKEKNS